MSTICTLCSLNEIGDEMHCLFKCPFFENARKDLLSYLPSIPNKLEPSHVSHIFESNCIVLLKSLSKFITIILNAFDDIADDDIFKPMVIKSQTTRVGRKIKIPMKYNDCVV